MARVNPAILAFNRGIVSPRAMARGEDIERVRLSAAEQENFMCHTLGDMMLRVGSTMLGSVTGQTNCIPFIFGEDDQAIIELKAPAMRVWVNDAVVSRGAVTAALTNGSFASDVSGWTDADETDATSAWATGGYLSLVGSGFNYAIRRQELTINEQGVEHALRIKVFRGTVDFRLGTSAGDDSIRNASLGAGEHSIAFTPSTASVWVEFANAEKRAVLVDSVEVESAGEMTLPLPYAAADVPFIRHDQSLDVVYLSCKGCPQKKIERRSTTSWSIVDYTPDNGPFEAINDTSITLTPSDLDGNITLTASKPVFQAEHVGALFKIESAGQTVSASLAGEDQSTDPIRVTGALTSRTFNINITNTFSATVTLERSIGDVGAWEDVVSWAGAITDVYNDELTNEVIYYRLTIKSGNYTSGTAVAKLVYSGGSISGVARVLAFNSNVSVDAEVVVNMGNSGASADWYEGAWSEEEGYPSAVVLGEGRLWWFGRNRTWGSESDEYEGFDGDAEGAAGPIDRTIGRGPVANIHWAVALNRIIIGTAGSVIALRSSSLDEPLTSADLAHKDASTQGTSNVAPVKVDTDLVYVHRSTSELMYLSASGGPEYAASRLNLLTPGLLNSGVKKLVVQRQPDTRIHALMNDGSVYILVMDPLEEVRAFLKYTTNGTVNDVVVLNGDVEDQVYYIVQRANGQYMEKWNLESQALGAADTRLADCGVFYSEGGYSDVLTGLSHLEGQSVVVWGNSKDLGTYTVSSGQITVSERLVGPAFVGLGYDARYRSTKMMYGTRAGSAIGQTKRINSLALILVDTHYQGVKYGPSFDYLDDLPAVEHGTETDADHVWAELETEVIPFDGEWETDPRLCLKASAPRAATICAAVVGVELREQV